MTAATATLTNKQKANYAIEKERAPLLADFFQKLDRMMTGLPVKVIIKNLNGALSSTDGKRIWIDWNVLLRHYSNEVRLGLNARELAHCFFGNTVYDRRCKKQFPLAANILLECRDISLFAEMYPATRSYFTAYVQEVLVAGRTGDQLKDIVPILIGLKFLPAHYRFNAAATFKPDYVLKLNKLINEFVALGHNATATKRAVALTEEFDALLKEQTTVSFHNPGGAILLKSLLDPDVFKVVQRNIKLVINNDKKVLSKKIRRMGSGTIKGAKKGGSSSPSGKTNAERVAEGKTVVTYEHVGEYRDVDLDGLSEEVEHIVSESIGTKKVANLQNTPSKPDLDLETIHGSNGHSTCGGNFATSDGVVLRAVVLEDDSDITIEDDFIWVNSDNFDVDPLATFKDVVTTESVRDILAALEEEVMFDDPLLQKSGWRGCGFVSAELRNLRRELDEELKLTAKMLRSRHEVGKRGPININAAMKSESGNPTTNIFKERKNYSSRTNLEAEVVMLLDASGSMARVINNVMKTQWLIGSAFENLGGNVTVIPFNNMARDPIKGRKDPYSNHVYPYCSADGGTQPQGALSVALDIFKKAGRSHKIMFMLTDGCWNGTEASHKLIDQLNIMGVQTVMVFMGGDARDAAEMERSRFHHCKLGTRINNVDELMPEMRRVFFREFKKAITKSLKVYH